MPYYIKRKPKKDKPLPLFDKAGVKVKKKPDYKKKLDEGMKGTMADYQIASVSETAIMDVYPYIPEEEKEKKEE